MGRASRKVTGGTNLREGDRPAQEGFDYKAPGFYEEAISAAEEYHNPEDWSGRSWEELTNGEQDFVIRETEAILRGYDGYSAPDISNFMTGVAPGDIAPPDERDPRIGGYKDDMSVEEAIETVERMKKNGVRLPNAMDQTELDHAWDLIQSKRPDELRRYLHAKSEEREEKLKKKGIKNTADYNTRQPTAEEAGAQYDIHSENITVGSVLEIHEGEKARLPGGQFIMGPATVRVTQSHLSFSSGSSEESERGLAVRVSAPDRQGVRLLSDPMDNDTVAPTADYDDMRKEWLLKRAVRITNDTRGKYAPSMEQAIERVRNNPESFGYDGEEDFDVWSKRAAQECFELCQKDRALNLDEAFLVAEAEFEDIKPRNRLSITLEPDGSVHSIEPLPERVGSKNFWSALNSTLEPRGDSPSLPYYSLPGVNPDVPQAT